MPTVNNRDPVADRATSAINRVRTMRHGGEVRRLRAVTGGGLRAPGAKPLGPQVSGGPSMRQADSTTGLRPVTGGGLTAPPAVASPGPGSVVGGQPPPTATQIGGPSMRQADSTTGLRPITGGGLTAPPVTSGPGFVAGGQPPPVVTQASSQSPDEIAAFWTPERMAAAMAQMRNVVTPTPQPPPGGQLPPAAAVPPGAGLTSLFGLTPGGGVGNRGGAADYLGEQFFAPDRIGGLAQARVGDQWQAPQADGMQAEALAMLPPRLQAAVQSGAMSLGAALGRHQQFLRNQLPGQAAEASPPSFGY